VIRVLALALACGLPASPAPGTPEAQVAAFQRELVIARRQGDRADLERLIADGFTFVHSTGGLDSKKEYVDNVVSAVQAGRGPDIERLEEHVQIYDGRTAVFTKAGHPARPRRRPAAAQHARLRPQAGAILTPAQREAYAGRYEVGPSRVLTVSVQGETLKALLPGFREAELIARSATEFAWFQPRPEHRSADRVR
jgi:hypothetical protein